MNPQLDNIIREVRDLVAGRSINAEVDRVSDPAIRQLIAEQLLAAMSSSDAAEQERARKIFISQGYLDETTNTFRSANSAAERAAAAYTLGLVGSRLATAHLVAGIFDSEPEVCRAAAAALARIGDPAVSMEPLNLLIDTNSDQTATGYSRNELRVVDASYVDTKRERDVVSSPSVDDERRVDSPRGVETKLSIERSFERECGVESLIIETNVADVAPEIVTGLNSLLPQERVTALEKLSRSGAKDVFKLIVNSFADSSPDVRNAAARALYELEPGHCAELFGRAIEETSPDQRRNIGAALAGSGVAGRVIEDLASGSRGDAYNSLCLLFAMAKTGEIQPLIQAIEEHQNAEVRRAAVKLLTLNGLAEIAAAAAKRRLMVPLN